MSDLDDLIAGVRSTANSAGWQTPDQIRARGDRRRRQHRVGVLASVVTVLLLAIGIPFVVVRHEASSPPVGTTPTAPITTLPDTPPVPAPPLVARIDHQGAYIHAVEPMSMAAGNGSVWLAFRGAPIAHTGDAPNAGDLVRLDAGTLTETAHWPIVGSPVAVAVTEQYVWVAGDVYDGRPVASGANQVQQFDLDGTLVHSYPVTGPVAMLGVAGDAVWVEYGESNGPTRLRQLHAGTASTPLTLTGPAPARHATGSLIGCPDGVFAESLDDNQARTYVEQIVNGAVVAKSIVDSVNDTWIGCATGGVLALTPDTDTSVLRALPFNGTPSRSVATPPGRSALLGQSDQALWIRPGSDSDGTTVQPLAKGPVFYGNPVEFPDSTVVLATGNGRTLWTVMSGASGQPDTWLIVAVTTN